MTLADVGRARLSLAVESALLAVALTAGIGLTRLAAGPGPWQFAAVVALSVVIGHVATALPARRAQPVVRRLALAVGAGSVVLVLVWWFAPGTASHGVPSTASVRALGQLLRGAFEQIRAAPTPLSPTAGVRLCIAGGAGLAAALARALAGHGRTQGQAVRARIGAALVPTTALFCYAALLSSDLGRVWSATAFIGAVGVLVAVDGASRSAVTGRRRAQVPGRGVALLAGALVVPLTLSPVLQGMRLDALPFHDGKGPGHGAVPAAALGLALADDLRGAIVSAPNVELFTVESPAPMYWQVAVLTRFRGRSWTPDRATASAAVGRLVDSRSAPLQLPEPVPASLVRASVAVEELRTRLLPVPAGAAAVRTGSSDVHLGPVGAVASEPSFPGLDYEALAAAPGSLSAPTAATEPAPSPSAEASYLELPPVPARVVALAHSIVRGATNDRARALALAGWFHSGRFRYSLRASTAADPLSDFLFVTRAGFCQQFAGAYAVLARLDGLPTRVAVGFTAGTRQSDTLFHVTSADAHAWPEVYLGPSAGWVSVEPTPAAGDGVVVAGVLYGTPVPGAAHGSTPSADLAHGGAGTVPGPTVPGQGTAPSGTVPSSVTGEPGSRRRPLPAWVWVAGSALAFGALLAALGARRLRRRLRHRRPESSVATGKGVARSSRRPRRLLAALIRRPLTVTTGASRRAVLESWDASQRALEQRGLGRAPAETMAEHASRLEEQDAALARPYDELCLLAQAACYAPDEPSAQHALAARRLGAEVRACARAAPHPRRGRVGGRGRSARRHDEAETGVELVERT